MAGGTALPAMHGGGLFPDTLDGKQNLGAVGGVSQAASTVTVALCRSSDTSGVTRRAGAPWLPCSAALTIQCIVTAADRMLCAIRQNDSGGGITGNVGG